MDENRNEHYGYFEQKPSKWDIIEFLEQYDLEPYSKKMDRYIKCLRYIARVKNSDVTRTYDSLLVLDYLRPFANQFYDVLPGSSIGMVYDDANKFYQELENTGTKLLDKALDTLFKISATASSSNKGFIVFNMLGWNRTEVVEVPVCSGLDTLAQYTEDKKSNMYLVSNIKDVVGMGSQSVYIRDSLDVTQVTGASDVLLEVSKKREKKRQKNFSEDK
ncbi:2004_t:CDS:2 [Dentiscutata erythropus]|uniref:2004_t:CDS:1 n=1 Tax=Dentiscutata erythropus TaxID=1348616 RepID=A0A9N9EHE0_9GLOM|nr:2004_t:CDS:2 [Dentiscutata erythropus]